MHDIVPFRKGRKSYEDCQTSDDVNILEASIYPRSRGGTATMGSCGSFGSNDFGVDFSRTDLMSSSLCSRSCVGTAGATRSVSTMSILYFVNLCCMHPLSSPTYLFVFRGCWMNYTQLIARNVSAESLAVRHVLPACATLGILGLSCRNEALHLAAMCVPFKWKSWTDQHIASALASKFIGTRTQWSQIFARIVGTYFCIFCSLISHVVFAGEFHIEARAVREGLLCLPLCKK